MKTAVQTTIDSFRQAWGIFEINDREKEALIQTIEKHNPKLLGHVKGLVEMAEMGKMITILADEIAGQQQQIATEQDIATAKLKEADEEFKAKFIKTTTLAYGLRALFNDPATMAEALKMVVFPTLKQAVKSLSLDERQKIYKALDEVFEEELGKIGP